MVGPCSLRWFGKGLLKRSLLQFPQLNKTMVIVNQIGDKKRESQTRLKEYFTICNGKSSDAINI